VVTLDQTLIPVEVQREIVEAVVNESVALSLGNVQPMPVGAESIPVLGSFPTAGFLTAVGGRKPTTTMSWTALRLQAEEIAATIDVPTAYIDDAGFPLWESIQPRMVEALSLVIDQAILFGTAAPASFPVGGVIANSTAIATLPVAPQNDIAGLFNVALSNVETQGLVPDGIAAGVSVKGSMRGARATTGEPLFVPSVVTGGAPDQVYGLPIYFSAGTAFTPATAVAIVGDWTNLRIGVRQDVTVDTSSEAVLADATGKVLVSAFQDDKIIMRVHMRLGCAIGRPITQRQPAGAKPWSHFPSGLSPTSAEGADEYGKAEKTAAEMLDEQREAEAKAHQETEDNFRNPGNGGSRSRKSAPPSET
jgi:HK97 family phage major capsid protein